MDQITNQIEFPGWVIRPVGHPILLENTFAGTFPNSKYGVFEGSTGTVTADTTDLFWGGAGGAKMLTAATIGDGSEVKCTIEPVCEPGDLLSFEAKWGQSFAQGTTQFQLGLEARTHSTIYQSRFQWTNATGRWQYENGTGTYGDFNALPSTTFTQAMYGDAVGGLQPNATIENPAVNTSAGTPLSWARIVINPFTRQYYSFEAPFVDGSGNGYARVWDMRGISLPSNGAASRALYLPFAYVITQTANAEPGFTTDWCVSVIPNGVAGGTLGTLQSAGI